MWESRICTKLKSLELLLPSVVLISLYISYVLRNRFLTLHRLASGVAIIAGFFTVLVVFTLNVNLPINANIRIGIGIAIEIFIIFMAVMYLLIPFLKSSEKFKLFDKLISQKLKW